MKKQIRRAFAAISLLVVAAICTTASAQWGRLVVVNVPFDFVVGNKKLPAGEYTVSRASRDSAKMLLVRRADGSAAVIVQTNTVETGAATDKAHLNFTQYEDQYFLAQVWTAGSSTGRELVKSRLQKSLERELDERRETGAEAANETAQATTVTIIGGVR